MMSFQPKLDKFKYRDLLMHIENGDFKIPKFQRDLVWALDKSAKLLDSIIRDFPVGTFVIWKTRDRLAHERDIGGTKIPDAKDNESVKYILDGQQRITTLFAAIRGLNIEGIDYRGIYLDMDWTDGDIVTTEERDNSISIHELLGKEDILVNPKYDDKTKLKLLKYRERFATYEFPVIELPNYPIEKAVDIFTRINTSGRPLALFEIMAAKTYDEELEFDLVDRHTKLNDELVDSKYHINGSTLLQSLSINLVKSCSRNDILNLDKLKIIHYYNKTVESIKNAVDYFRSVYGIQVSRLLPYEALVVPFQWFFFINGNKRPDQKQATSLRAYFWRASLTSRFSKAVESTLERDCRLVSKIYSGGENQELDEIKVTLTADDIKYHRFSTGEAVCKSVLCMLASLKPKSLYDNSDVVLDESNLSRSNGRNYHHIFPKAYLRKLSITDQNVVSNITLVSSIENIKIGAKPPSEYMKEFAEENPQLRNTLSTHLIGGFEDYGIATNNYEQFLSRRSKRIYKELKNRFEL